MLKHLFVNVLVVRPWTRNLDPYALEHTPHSPPPQNTHHSYNFLEVLADYYFKSAGEVSSGKLAKYAYVELLIITTALASSDSNYLESKVNFGFF
jgi:hypothetical protein